MVNMAELKKYTLEDLEAISGDIKALSVSSLCTAFSNPTHFPHTLIITAVASCYGLPTKRAFDAPNVSAGLEFLVQRWNLLAERFPTGVSIGFFDREGTTFEKEIGVPNPNGTVSRVEMGYPIQAADHVFIPGAVEALQAQQTQGLNILLTGQSGVARGYFTEADMAIHLETVLRNAARQGVIFDAVLYCPHHPQEGQGEYKVDCGGRKGRGYGMLTEALAVFKTVGVPIDIQRSFVVGDKKDDVLTAELFNQAWAARYGGETPLRSFLVDTGYAGGTNDALVRELKTEYSPAPVGIASIRELPAALTQAGIYK